MTTILVVEDNRSLREALVYNLRHEGYTSVVATDAPTAVEQARRESPNLILLDLMLPGGDGFDVCRTIRSFSAAPIIMVTARGEDVDRVLGLEIGADDYVTKPFNLREVLARIKANLRRVEMDRGETDEEILTLGELTVNVAERRAEAGGQAIAFQPKEFDLLVYFLRHPDTVLTRIRILHAVWGHDFVGERTVDVHVRRVRSKLEAAGMPNVIRTAHGVGYALDARQYLAGRQTQETAS